MKRAVSSIAWTKAQDDMWAERLHELGVTAIEVAPTKQWDDPTTVDQREATRFAEWWKSRGLEIVACQSLLYARPDLKIFESASNRAASLDYLKRFIRLAGWIGAKKLVFGSPKNRQKGELAIEEADSIAARFFEELGTEATNNGVVLCLEPNAPQYACDFITTAEQGDALVRRVNNDGFKLHLDTACMTLAGDDIAASIRRSADILSHFHASAPMLEPVGRDDGVDHTAAAEALRAVEYDGFVSLEMKPNDDGEAIESAVAYLMQMYS